MKNHLFFSDGNVPGRSSTTPRSKCERPWGFSLIELLAVIAIISLLSVATGPAFQALSGAGTLNRSISDLCQTIELARTYAMANHTWVRLAFSQIPAGPSGQGTPEIAVLAMYAANGQISGTNGTSQSMADASSWPLLNRPLVLKNLISDDSLNAASPVTSNDTLPSQSDMASAENSFVRSLPSFSSPPKFTSCIQMTPAGEVQVLSGTPARYIKMAFDRPSPQNGKNPFILRVGGISGTVAVLRKENGIQ